MRGGGDDGALQPPVGLKRGRDFSRSSKRAVKPTRLSEVEETFQTALSSSSSSMSKRLVEEGNRGAGSTHPCCSLTRVAGWMQFSSASFLVTALATPLLLSGASIQECISSFVVSWERAALRYEIQP